MITIRNTVLLSSYFNLQAFIFLYCCFLQSFSMFDPKCSKTKLLMCHHKAQDIQNMLVQLMTSCWWTLNNQGVGILAIGSHCAKISPKLVSICLILLLQYTQTHTMIHTTSNHIFCVFWL